MGSGNKITKRRVKSTAIILTIILGWCGGHKFYLGDKNIGFIYMALFWSGIPAILACIDMWILVFMNKSDFREKYRLAKVTN
jgi:TM2 domain-containing membrane protein YozV